MSNPYEVCATVLALVQDQLVACKRPVGQTGVAVGGVVVDDCCAGALFVSPERVFRWTTPFPTEVGPDPVGESSDMIAVTLVVRLYRCVPVLDDNGNAPTSESQEGAALGLLTDAAIVWRVVTGSGLIAAPSADDPYERAGVEQLYEQALGGCMGIETRFTLGIPVTDWCFACP